MYYGCIYLFTFKNSWVFLGIPRNPAASANGGRTGAAASGCVGEGKGGDGIGSGWDGGNLGFLGRVRECVIYTGGY